MCILQSFSKYAKSRMKKKKRKWVRDHNDVKIYDILETKKMKPESNLF